ncbi:MAG: helix-hairpin-helix domain-containing protein [Intestinibacter sp.]
MGPAKKKALLKQFGGVQKIKEASIEEIAKVPGITKKLAEAIKQALN